jgi:hypothetical protein
MDRKAGYRALFARGRRFVGMMRISRALHSRPSASESCRGLDSRGARERTGALAIGPVMTATIDMKRTYLICEKSKTATFL